MALIGAPALACGSMGNSSGYFSSVVTVLAIPLALSVAVEIAILFRVGRLGGEAFTAYFLSLAIKLLAFFCLSLVPSRGMFGMISGLAVFQIVHFVGLRQFFQFAYDKEMDGPTKTRTALLASMAIPGAFLLLQGVPIVLLLLALVF